MRMRLLATLALLAVMPLPAADNPGIKALLAHWAKSKDYAIELAKQMPAESYASRPNDAEMTYGEQMLHIANGILFMTKAYAPEQHASFDPKKADKDTAIAALQAAFDVGARAIGTFSDEDLTKKTVESGEGKMLVMEALILLMDHVEHHRGQAVVYLRFKGIKPVDYRF